MREQTGYRIGGLQLPDFEGTNGKGGWVIEKGRDARVVIGGSMVLVRGAGGSFALNARLGVCRVHVQGKRGRGNVEYV